MTIGRLCTSCLSLKTLCRRRVEFTDADEDNLCKWLALRVPYKEYGGRGGNGLYKDLVERVRKLNNSRCSDGGRCHHGND